MPSKTENCNKICFEFRNQKIGLYPLKDDELEPKLMENDPAPVELRDITHLLFNDKNWSTKKCKYLVSGFLCTDICECADCENKNMKGFKSTTMMHLMKMCKYDSILVALHVLMFFYYLIYSIFNTRIVGYKCQRHAVLRKLWRIIILLLFLFPQLSWDVFY